MLGDEEDISSSLVDLADASFEGTDRFRGHAAAKTAPAQGAVEVSRKCRLAGGMAPAEGYAEHQQVNQFTRKKPPMMASVQVLVTNGPVPDGIPSIGVM